MTLYRGERVYNNAPRISQIGFCIRQSGVTFSMYMKKVSIPSVTFSCVFSSILIFFYFNGRIRLNHILTLYFVVLFGCGWKFNFTKAQF